MSLKKKESWLVKATGVAIGMGEIDTERQVNVEDFFGRGMEREEAVSSRSRSERGTAT